MSLNETGTSLEADDLAGFITYDTRRSIENVLTCGFLPVIFLVGVFGNILSLLVLARQGARETTNIILISLTITDLLYVLTSFVLDMKCIVGIFSPRLAVTVESVSKASLLVFVFLLGRVSALFICLIAVERYIAVLLPLKASVLLTRRRVTLACVSLYFIGFTPSICLFFVFDLQDSYDPRFNATVTIVTFTEFFIENFDILNYYSNFALSIVFRLIPVALISFCTVSIVNTLRKTSTERHTLSSELRSGKIEADQRRVTKTLLSVCILFIVCIIPNIILEIARIIFAKDGFNDVGRYSNISAVVLALVNMCSMINSSVNFVLYILTSSKFASVAWGLFRPGRISWEGKRPTQSVSGTQRRRETEDA